MDPGLGALEAWAAALGYELTVHKAELQKPASTGPQTLAPDSIGLRIGLRRP